MAEYITQDQAMAIVKSTVTTSEYDDLTIQSMLCICNAAVAHYIASQKQFLNAEEYLRHKYGAYRGFPAWREIEEGYNQGRYDEAMAQGPDYKGSEP